ncbi:MAG: hypothetical protein H0W86_05895 [Armatimonadetes bacterium]|nr:hypothetical protein [Armatimonadota bacterium]
MKLLIDTNIFIPLEPTSPADITATSAQAAKLSNATAPVSTIVAVLEIAALHEDTPSNIWKMCASHGAIRADWFYGYFDGRDAAVAIELARVVRLEQPLPLQAVFPGAGVPQSFRYISAEGAEWARSVVSG